MSVRKYFNEKVERLFPGKTIEDKISNEIKNFFITRVDRVAFYWVGGYAIVLFLLTIFFHDTSMAGSLGENIVGFVILLGIYFGFSDFLKRKAILSQPAQFLLDSICYLSLMLIIIYISGGYDSYFRLPFFFLATVSAAVYSANFYQLGIFLGFISGINLYLYFGAHSGSEHFVASLAEILAFVSNAGIVRSTISLVSRNETRLIASEAKYRALFDSSPDCIKVLDLKGELLTLSRGGLLEHGFKTQGEAQNWNYLKTIEKEFVPKIKKALKQAAAGKTTSFDVRHVQDRNVK
ncbi:hypothetical protein KKC32_00660 [Patescibacteria group bacterium]|nr:hypothetical protein [Patescibacteria group bacterium]